MESNFFLDYVRGSLEYAAQYKDQPFSYGAKMFWKEKDSRANGSLMRNVIPALFPKPDEELLAIENTILQAIITHFGIFFYSYEIKVI